MKVGILAAGTSPDELADRHGTYADMVCALLQRAGMDAEFSVYEVRNDDFPDTVECCDAWVITGSRHNVDEGMPWIGRLERMVPEILAAGKPLAGICFGHQLIAQALGGRVERFSGGWGLGLQEYALLDSAHLETEGRRSFRINAIHQYQVVEKPASADVFATSESCRFAGLLYGEQVITLQAHPEFSSDFERELLVLRKSSAFPDEAASRALAALDQCPVDTDSDQVGQWLAQVLCRAA